MLNPQQMAAVRYLDGPLLVLAGAGSGKTRVITEKIVYLLKTCGYSPRSVLAVTFTNKAAQEMQSRIKQALPMPERRGLWVTTFHTLGLRMIKQHVKAYGLHAGFSIFDTEDALQIIKSLLPSGRVNNREEVTAIQHILSQWKNARYSADEGILYTTPGPFTDRAYEIYQPYQAALRAYNAVDFDDLISLPVDICLKNPDILQYWQQKIRYLLVDEYQDSNACQLGWGQTPS